MQPGRHRLSTSYKLRDIIQVVDKSPTPSLLPIFRSQQQAELLALILGDPTAEHSMTELAERTGVPYPTLFRSPSQSELALRALRNQRDSGSRLLTN